MKTEPQYKAGPKPLPSRERLREFFRYDEELGGLVWLRRKSGSPRLDALAGCINRERLRRMVGIDGTLYYHARLVWCWHYGDPAEWLVDHIDRNPLNDAIPNLRLASISDNCANASVHKDNLSGVRGVSWHEASKKWLARLYFGGKTYYLGVHASIDDAAAAYTAKLLELHGTFLEATQ